MQIINHAQRTWFDEDPSKGSGLCTYHINILKKPTSLPVSNAFWYIGSTQSIKIEIVCLSLLPRHHGKNQQVTLYSSYQIMRGWRFLAVKVELLGSLGQSPRFNFDNYLVGTNTRKIFKTVSLILEGKGKDARIPKYWDGNAGDRIIKVLVEIFDQLEGKWWIFQEDYFLSLLL